jgi:hypothetical protein
VTNEKYIGKKTFGAFKYKQVNNKRKKIRVESDWKKYYGSSPKIKDDVKALGHENFKREILHLCKSKSMQSYLELREQIDRRVLESNDYYNDWIMVRVRKSNVKF